MKWIKKGSPNNRPLTEKNFSQWIAKFADAERESRTSLDPPIKFSDQIAAIAWKSYRTITEPFEKFEMFGIWEIEVPYLSNVFQ